MSATHRIELARSQPYLDALSSQLEIQYYIMQKYEGSKREEVAATRYEALMGEYNLEIARLNAMSSHGEAQ